LTVDKVIRTMIRLTFSAYFLAHPVGVDAPLKYTQHDYPEVE